MKYDLKQGSEKQQFSTGAQRDTQEGKSRPDLIGAEFLLELGDLMNEDPNCCIHLLCAKFLHGMGVVAHKGAVHYGDNTWKKGMPLSRILASAFRHLLLTMVGEEEEDHPAQCAWNMMAYDYIRDRIRAGELPAELDDMPREKNLEATLTSAKKLPTIGRTRRVWHEPKVPQQFCKNPRCQIEVYPPGGQCKWCGTDNKEEVAR